MSDSDEANIAVLQLEVRNLQGEVEQLRAQVSGVMSAANKATGGFIVLVALGSVLTWGATLGDRISKWFH